MDKETEKNLLEIVKNNYEEIVVSFNSTRTKYIWPELLKLTARVKDGDRVLDVGCGNGRLLHALSGKSIKYLGIDESLGLIETAKINWKMSVSLRDGDWRFANGNILKLDEIAEKDFDYAYCVAVLHHLPGEDLRIEALKQMKNKVQKNGRIIITVWNLWNQKKFGWLIYKYAFLRLIGKNKMDCGDILFDWKNSNGQAVSQRYYHAFTFHELRKISKKAGLKIEKLYNDEHNYYLILKP